MTESYLKEQPKCFYDTNVLAAYLLGEESRLEIAEHVLRSCSMRGISVVTIHELSYIILRRGLEVELGEVMALIERAFIVHELTRDIALAAAHIRLEHGIPEVDSLILATAVKAGYNIFYTFDSDFETLNGRMVEQTKIIYLE